MLYSLAVLSLACQESSLSKFGIVPRLPSDYSLSLLTLHMRFGKTENENEPSPGVLNRDNDRSIMEINFSYVNDNNTSYMNRWKVDYRMCGDLRWQYYEWGVVSEGGLGKEDGNTGLTWGIVSLFSIVIILFFLSLCFLLLEESCYMELLIVARQYKGSIKYSEKMITHSGSVRYSL